MAQKIMEAYPPPAPETPAHKNIETYPRLPPLLCPRNACSQNMETYYPRLPPLLCPRNACSQIHGNLTPRAPPHPSTPKCHLTKYVKPGDEEIVAGSTPGSTRWYEDNPVAIGTAVAGTVVLLGAAVVACFLIRSRKSRREKK